MLTFTWLWHLSEIQFWVVSTTFKKCCDTRQSNAPAGSGTLTVQSVLAAREERGGLSVPDSPHSLRWKHTHTHTHTELRRKGCMCVLCLWQQYLHNRTAVCFYLTSGHQSDDVMQRRQKHGDYYRRGHEEEEEEEEEEPRCHQSLSEESRDF